MKGKDNPHREAAVAPFSSHKPMLYPSPAARERQTSPQRPSSAYRVRGSPSPRQALLFTTELRPFTPPSTRPIVGTATPTQRRSTSPTRRRTGSPSKHNHEYVSSYQYFQKVVDPLISACVTKFLWIQPLAVTHALRLYFEAMKEHGIVSDDVFHSCACEEPKKNDQIYFSTISPCINLLIAAISESQPRDLIDYILSHDLLKRESVLGAHADTSPMKGSVLSFHSETASSSSRQASPAVQPPTPLQPLPQQPTQLQQPLTPLTPASSSSLQPTYLQPTALSSLQPASAQSITEPPPQATLSQLPIVSATSETMSIYASVADSTGVLAADSTGVLAAGSASESEGGESQGVSTGCAVLRLYSDDMSSVGMMSTTHPSHPQSYDNRYVPLDMTLWEMSLTSECLHQLILPLLPLVFSH